MNDNQHLFNDLYKNVRMATYGIDCIMDAIDNKHLTNLIKKQNDKYLEYTTTLENISKDLNLEILDINPFLKASSFTSIKMKTMLNAKTTHLCDMLIQGTTMGITTTLISLVDNPNADSILVDVANSIRDSEEAFIESLKDIILLSKQK